MQVAAARGEERGDADADGGVHIVAAGVHHAGVAALVAVAALLGDGECVHVGAEEERGAGMVAFEGGDDAVAGDAGGGGEAGCAERLCHLGGGAGLLVGELRVAVEVAAEGDELFGRERGHAEPSGASPRGRCGGRSRRRGI